MNRTITLPITYYRDYMDRELPAGRIERVTRLTVTVQLDQAAFDEMLSDASYYAAPHGGAVNDPSLKRSAERALRRLLAARDRH